MAAAHHPPPGDRPDAARSGPRPTSCRGRASDRDRTFPSPPDGRTDQKPRPSSSHPAYWGRGCPSRPGAPTGRGSRRHGQRSPAASPGRWSAVDRSSRRCRSPGTRRAHRLMGLAAQAALHEKHRPATQVPDQRPGLSRRRRPLTAVVALFGNGPPGRPGLLPHSSWHRPDPSPLRPAHPPGPSPPPYCPAAAPPPQGSRVPAVGPRAAPSLRGHWYRHRARG